MAVVSVVREARIAVRGDEKPPVVPTQMTVDGGMVPRVLSSQALIGEACMNGLRKVVVAKPVDLLAGPDQAVPWLRAIRDLTSCSVEVDWTLQGGQELERLFSLRPPRAIPANPSACSQWREEFRYGLLYWRSGPGFVSIRSNRHGRTEIFTLESEAYVSAFLSCVDGRRVPAGPTGPYRDLEADGLLYRVGDWLVTVPFRMRHWPVPFNAV